MKFYCNNQYGVVCLAMLYHDLSGFSFRLVFGFHSRMSSDSNSTVSSASSVNSTENWTIDLNIRSCEWSPSSLQVFQITSRLMMLWSRLRSAFCSEFVFTSGGVVYHTGEDDGSACSEGQRAQ